MKALGISLAIVANLIIAPIALILLSWIDEVVRSWVNWPLSSIKSLYLKMFGRAQRVGERYVGIWGYLGLALFDAIPVPGSGAWTGSLIAYILGLKRRWSLISIEAGVLIASGPNSCCFRRCLKTNFLDSRLRDQLSTLI